MRFVQCYPEDWCVEAEITVLIFVFARQVLKEKSDMSVEYLVQEAASTYIKEVERLKKNLVLSRWNVPKGLPPFQTLPRHILLWLRSYYRDFSLIEHGLRISVKD